MTTPQPKLKLIDKAQDETRLAGQVVHTVATRTNYPASAANLTILQKLRILNTPPSPQLFGAHPLADRALDFRLQYLAAVAMLIALEREPTPAEQQSFIDLGAALGVDMPDVQEQLSERASLSVDDIAVLLDAVRAEQAAWPFLLDVAWIHAADGDFDANELAATQEISTLFATHLDAACMAGRLVLALRQRSRAIFEELPKVFDLEPLRPYLPALLASFFPFSNLVGHRWLDHGNGFVTDCTSGVMWPRFFVGQRWKNGTAVGAPRTYGHSDSWNSKIQYPEDFSWERELNEINSSFQLGGFGDWQFLNFKNQLSKIIFFYDECNNQLSEVDYLKAELLAPYYHCKFINEIIFSYVSGKYILIAKDDNEFRFINVGDSLPEIAQLILCRDALPATVAK